MTTASSPGPTAPPPAPPRRGSWTVSVIAVAAIGLVFVAIGTLPAEPLYRAWRAGAIIPGRMAAEPWRWLMAPLVHLEPGHLLGNALCLAALARAATRAVGGAWAAVAAGAAAVLGAAASAALDPAWLHGASGAVFGLVGVCVGAVMRRPPGGTGRRWLIGLIALAGGWAWLAPDDRVAHLVGGLVGGVFGYAAARRRDGEARWAPQIGRGLAALMAIAFIAAAAQAARFDGAPRGWRVVSTGAQPLRVPDHWTPGGPLPPCPATWTDGLLTACMLPGAWSMSALGERLTAAGHRPHTAERHPAGIRLGARPGGQGELVLWRQPGGPILLVHAASASAAAARASHIAELRDRNLKLSARPPSAGRPDRADQ